MSPNIPKAFVSHASEDKNSFVIPFATKLIENGIDAWVDKWEMKAGDKVLDKIFDEGIAQAEYFIIILSSNSITKPWVKEELSAAVVNRLNDKTTLIPIVIDDCKIPQVLKSTLWVNYNSSDTPESIATKIINIIFKKNEKPQLGKPPAYTLSSKLQFPNLSKIDLQILELLCDNQFNLYNRVSKFETLKLQAKEADISDEALQESIEFLYQKSYIGGTQYLRGKIDLVKVNPYPFEQYLRAKFADYEQTRESIAYDIVNQNIRNSSNLQIEGKPPKVLIAFIIDTLESEGHLRVVKYGNDRRKISSVSPSLKRSLQK